MIKRVFKRERPSSTSTIASEDQVDDMPGLSQDHPLTLGDIPMASDAEMTDFRDPPLIEPLGTKDHRERIRNGLTASHLNLPETISATTDKGLEILGRGVKELVQAVQKLRHLGIEDLDLPLPKIVIIGDQSTGKSSLIEGMSEIKVPRDVGTCTRCPLEINISENLHEKDGWSCKISLLKKYTYEGTDLVGKSSKGATRRRPLGPWAAQDGEDFHFATLGSKEEVPHVLRLAQLATLNPSNPPDIYLPGREDPGNRKQVQFSPNVVQLDISGPGLPNLSFYDLPGVINVSEATEDAYLVDLVKNLVKEYIKDESCLNILAISMTDDPANSSAFDLVRQVGAVARTVGVLTKPDRVQQSESFEQWIDVLSGRKFNLGFGYHVIKNNPDPAVDHATARREEADFFSESPWNDVLIEYSDRFGTVQLQTALSHKLTTQIKNSLPKIIGRVLLKSAVIDVELKKIPEIPSGNLPMKILETILQFNGEIGRQFEGGCQDYPFQKEWHKLATEFRKVLADSEPILSLADSRPSFKRDTDAQDDFANRLPDRSHPRSNKRSTPPETICVDDDDDENAMETPSKKQRRRDTVANVVPRMRSTTAAEPIPQTPPLPRTPVFEQTTDKLTNSRLYARKFYLDELRSIIQDAHIGLPGQTDPRAIERIVHMSMQSWDEPLRKFMSQTEDLCLAMIRLQVDTTFAHWQRTRLYDKLQSICEAFVKSKMHLQRQSAENYLLLELYKPMTFDSEALEDAFAKARAKTQKCREEWRAKVFTRQHMKEFSHTLNLDQKIAKVLTDKRLGPDEYGKEVEIMGTVKGYYGYALSRFVDVIGLGIQGDLFKACRTEISQALKDEIGLTEKDAHDRCADLLEVDTENRERRIQLKREKQRIQEAQSWLESLCRDDPNLLADPPFSE